MFFKKYTGFRDLLINFTSSNIYHQQISQYFLQNYFTNI